MMKTECKTLHERNHMGQLEVELSKLLVEISKRGFFGTAGIVLSVQDGRIQNIRVSTERMVR